MSFAEVHAAHPWDEVLASVQRKTEADVLRALARAEADSADLEDFKALISPAAAPHLERMARLSHERTLRRYGVVVTPVIGQGYRLIRKQHAPAGNH